MYQELITDLFFLGFGCLGLAVILQNTGELKEAFTDAFNWLSSLFSRKKDK